MTAAAEELVPAGPAGNAVSEVAQLPPPTEEESHRVVEQVWRFFCSLRLTLANLLLLFLSMIAGTFVNPSNDSLTNIERAFAGRPWVLGAYRWFELYDLFHSWWFTALLTSLVLNLVACSLERLPRIYYLVRYPERRLDRVIGLRFRVPPAPSVLTSAHIAETLQKRGYKVQESDGFVFAARDHHRQPPAPLRGADVLPSELRPARRRDAREDPHARSCDRKIARADGRRRRGDSSRRRAVLSAQRLQS